MSRSRSNPPSGQRLRALALWPFGIGLTSWNYLWRTTPMHRRELLGSAQADSPPELPAEANTAGLQREQDGFGPLFHRRYMGRIVDASLAPEAVVAELGRDLNRATPTEFARFHKIRGGNGLSVGDEYLVHMPGPWNGPVRVVHTTPTSFRLATLTGHLEAGQIEFRAAASGRELVFTIESWARSGDRLSDLLYQHLRMAKETQLHMWITFVERVARLSGGRLIGGVDIETRRVQTPIGARLLGDDRARTALEQLHARQPNYSEGSMRPEDGWLVEDRRQPLPPEPPGPPRADGSFAVARRLLREYEFADPSIVRAVYHPEDPLDRRDMLLELRVYGLRFRVGVRVTGHRDETIVIDGRPAAVWGWSYTTLEGHLEEGRRAFEVWKWLDSGDVEFRTHAFSRAASRNAVIRLGFRLLGRPQQAKFVRRACERMLALTTVELEGRPDPDPVPRAADTVAVASAEELA